MNVIKPWFSQLSKVNKWLLSIGVSLLIVGISYKAYWTYYWEIENVKYEIKAFLGDPEAKYHFSQKIDIDLLCRSSGKYRPLLKEQLELAKQGNEYARAHLFYSLFPRREDRCFNPSQWFLFKRNTEKLISGRELSWLYNGFEGINWINKEYYENSKAFARLIVLYSYLDSSIYYSFEKRGKKLFDDVVAWCKSFKGFDDFYKKAESDLCLEELREELYYDYDDNPVGRAYQFWHLYLDQNSDDSQFYTVLNQLHKSRYENKKLLWNIKKIG